MKYVFRKKMKSFAAAALDAVGAPLSHLSAGPQENPWEKPGSVLVVRLDHLGDVLLSSAFPKALKENFPNQRVLFLCSSRTAPLLQNNPFIDEVIVYDAPWFWKGRGGKVAGPGGFAALAASLKKRNIRAAFSLRGDLRENLLVWLAGIPHRFGYGITGGGFFLNRESSYRSNGHEKEHLLDLLRAAGVRTADLEPRIYLTAEEEARFLDRWAASGFGRDRGWVGLQVHAGSPSKDWDPELLKEFLSKFKRHLPGRRLVLVGTSAKHSDSLGVSGNPDVLNLVGKTSLRELCCLVKNLDLFIGPDSGPAHLASALGAPTLFLFSGTNDFERWRPTAQNAKVLRHTVPCAPCHLDRCVVKGHPCMNGILPDEVLSAAASMLRGA